MPSKQPLSVWLSEIFFEDNERFGRKAPRVSGMLRKMFTALPHGIALLFSNFAATYPRAARGAEPAAAMPAENLDLAIDEWPRHPELGIERGLPHSDSLARSIHLGSSLAGVSDVVFAMREVHRVCRDGGSVTVRLTTQDALAADPTLVRPITHETLAFFTPQSKFAEKARRAGAAELFEITASDANSVTLRAINKAAPKRPSRIDIGCGTTPRAGYSGIDFMALPGVEIIRDVERHGLPFSDSTITHVYTAHFLEHVRSLVFVMNEIHRVCCHDAIVEISVPTLLGPYAAADPTHVHFFNARTFSYFEAGSEPYAGIVKGFQILEQSVGFSLNVKLRVVKN